MSSKGDTFSKKIKELSVEEIEYTEDFFKKAFGENTASNMEVLGKTASEGAPRSISETYGEKDIDENWLEDNEAFAGQLAVDVFQTEEDIVITSTVAGVKAEDLDLDMNGDMITIRGRRRHAFEDVPQDDYFIRECFWGGFSRSVILPVDIQHDKVEASLENGILTIKLPKSKRSRNSKIDIVEVQ